MNFYTVSTSQRALMVALGAAFYLVIYTIWLKRASPWNVVIGGFAGCFAGLSGWPAAVNTLSLMLLLIAMLDFLWTSGHLWGLAIKKVKEYKNAGVPMLPVKVGLVKASQIVFSLNVLTVAFSMLFLLYILRARFTWLLLWWRARRFCFKTAVCCLQRLKQMGLKCLLRPCLI